MQNSRKWIASLDLTYGEKSTLETGGFYQTSTCMQPTNFSAQLPHLEGRQSTVLVQNKAFSPMNLLSAGGYLNEGTSSVCSA